MPLLANRLSYDVQISQDGSHKQQESIGMAGRRTASKSKMAAGRHFGFSESRNF